MSSSLSYRVRRANTSTPTVLMALLTAKDQVGEWVVISLH